MCQKCSPPTSLGNSAHVAQGLRSKCDKGSVRAGAELQAGVASTGPGMELTLWPAQY